MFDLITSDRERPLRERSPMSKVVAAVMHVVLVTVVVVVPLLRITKTLPMVPSIMAFVAEPPPPPAPPPPPPPPRPAAPARDVPAPPARTELAFATPIEAPNGIALQRGGLEVASAGGVEGGVEGGVAGGIAGGIVGGLMPPPPPPPPPPPSPALPPPRVEPVRLGGQLTPPALVRRVEPVYPDIAVVAQMSGLVILEAVVATDGCVESVKVLRSRNQWLDKAAVDALKQWQYAPLVLNGIPTPFVLTVTFNFSVGKR